MTDKSVIISAYQHPFKSERVTHLATAGQNLVEIIESNKDLSPMLLTAPGVRIFVDDLLVPRPQWDICRPSAGQLVDIKVTPTGRGKDGLRIIATIAVLALAIAAPYMAGSIFMAKGALTGWGMALSMTISTVGMLLVNALIPPQMPKDPDLDDGPDVYSIQGSRNSADPWGTCNKIYGLHKVYPHHAALPYTESIGDDQYLRCLFDIGQVPLSISDYKIGETALVNFNDVQTQLYESNSLLGAPNPFNQYSLYPYQVYEEQMSVELEYNVWNTRTTDEDIEEIQVELTFPQGLFRWNSETGNRLGTEVYFHVQYSPAGENAWKYLSNVRLVTITGLLPTLTRWKSWQNSPWAHGNQVTGVYSGATGTILFCNMTTVYQENVVYEYGGSYSTYDPINAISSLYIELTSGTFLPSEPIRLTVGTATYLSTINDQGTTTSVYRMNPKTFRHGVRVKVPKGQYDIRVQRYTLDDREDTVDASYWTVLRGLRFHDENGNYAIPVTAKNRLLLAMRIKASGQLNGVIDQFNVMAQAHLKIHNGTNLYYGVTRNPTWAYVDVLIGLATTSPVALNRIDWPKMIAWANRNAIAERTFDAVIDFQKPRRELLADIATVGRGSFGMRDNLISVVEDLTQSVPAAHIGPRNSWGYKGKKIYADLPHAFRVRFVNAAKDYVTDEIDVYRDGYNKNNATKFEILDCWGITNEINAAKEARFQIAQAQLRPEVHTIYQDVENVRYTRGDMVRFSHPVILVGLGSARVKATTLDGGGNVTAVTFDDIFPMETGKNYSCRFRLSNGVSTYGLVVTSAGEKYTVSFSPPISVMSKPVAGDLAFFGESGLETINCIVTRVEAGNDLSAKVTMVDDAPAVRTADQVLPEWQSNITKPPIINRAPPAVTIVSAEFNQYEIVRNADGSLSTEMTVLYTLASFNEQLQEVVGFHCEWRTNDGDWERTVEDGSARRFTFKVFSGYSYDVRVRSFSSPGLYSSWATSDDIIVDLTTYAGYPGDVQNLRVVGGGVLGGGAEPGGGTELVQEFAGRDCEVAWTPVVAAGGTSRVDGYKIEIRRTDESLLRIEFVSVVTAGEATEEPHYNYTYEKNREDNSGDPIREFKIYVWAHNLLGKFSLNSAFATFQNPAPNMASITPSVTGRYNYLEIKWQLAADLDISHYNVYCDISNPATSSAFVFSVNHPDNQAEIHGLDYGFSYKIIITPFDLFGEGISTGQGSGSILAIPSINVVSELSGSITMTDSDGNTAATLTKLYDGNKTSNGVSYTVSGTDKYIQYAYSIVNYFDRVAVWTSSASTRAYIAYSDDGGGSWDYLKAEADHTLDSNGALLLATNQADAQTNYWQLAIGFNWALWPNNLVANRVRLYIRGSYTTTIYEFVPDRILIGELAAIGHLSAITSDIGAIMAGTLQSSDYGANAGMLIDLDNRTIKLGGYTDPFFSCTGTTISISAGLVQSPNWGSAAGMQIDLDNQTIQLGGYTSPFFSCTATTVLLRVGTILSEDWSSTAGCALVLNSSPYMTFGGWTSPKVSITTTGATIKAGVIQSNNYVAGTSGLQFDLNNAVLTVYQTNGISIKGGGGLKVEGDVIFLGHASTPGKLVFDGTSYDSYLGTNAAGTLIELTPTTDNVVDFKVGQESSTIFYSGVQKLFKNIELHAGLAAKLQVGKDTIGQNRAKVGVWKDTDGDPVWSYLQANGAAGGDGVYMESSTASGLYFGPLGNKTVNLGRASYAFDTAYADDYVNVADFYWLDERVEGNAIISVDDIEVIKAIRPSSEICSQTGLRKINDTSIPQWLLHKHARDGGILVTNEEGNLTKEYKYRWKKGNVALTADGKPYLSLKTMISLLMGAIRQLDDKIIDIDTRMKNL